MNEFKRSASVILDLLPSTEYLLTLVGLGQTRRKPQNDTAHSFVLRSDPLEKALEEGGVSGQEPNQKARTENTADGHNSPNSGSKGQIPNNPISNTNNNELDGQKSFTTQLFGVAVSRYLIRALGTSALPSIVISACYPWLKYVRNEAFLGLAVLTLVWPMAEMAVVHLLLEERSHMRHIGFLRSLTFVSLLIMFSLAHDFPLWHLFFIAEGIQMTTIAIEQHFLTPSTPMTIAKIRFCIIRTIVYRVQLAVMAAVAIASFYVNFNGIGVTNAMHVVIAGMVFPILKTLFVIQYAAYRAHLFGKKNVPSPGMEIAVESSLCYPSKLSIILSFPFNNSFLTAVLLCFISRSMIRLLVVGAIRYSEKPGSEERHGRFVRFLNPLADGLKYAVTFTDAGEFVATIVAAVSSLVVSGWDIEMSLIYKISVILLAESCCNLLAIAEGYRNGWLVPEYSIWVGPVPTFFLLRVFGLYLVTYYAIL